VTTQQSPTDNQGEGSPGAADTVGVVMATHDFFKSYKRHDGSGMVVSGIALTASRSETTMAPVIRLVTHVLMVALVA